MSTADAIQSVKQDEQQRAQVIEVCSQQAALHLFNGKARALDELLQLRILPAQESVLQALLHLACKASLVLAGRPDLLCSRPASGLTVKEE